MKTIEPIVLQPRTVALLTHALKGSMNIGASSIQWIDKNYPDVFANQI